MMHSDEFRPAAGYPVLVEEIKSRVHNLYIILQRFAETAQVRSYK